MSTKNEPLHVLIEEMDGSLWAAATEKGRLQGLEVDPVNEEVRWGSIYWAKVARIDSALDAAFVNLDGDNIGLLHNTDVRIRQKDGTYKKGGDVAIGKLIEPGQMIAVQSKEGYLPQLDENNERVKEDKRPRVSMNINLPGRYAIYTPMEKDNQVSRRIRDKKLRKQLMTMLDDMKDVQGCILRAAAADTQTDILIRESKILAETWRQVQTYFEGDDPSLIMLGPDAIQRMLGDHANRPIQSIEITTMDHFRLVEEWCEVYAPDLVTKIQPVEIDDDEMGLLEFHDLIGQVEELFQPYAVLREGGVIIIQEAAAFAAIDVNSGADKRGKLAINMDAGKELARQIRLRNMGGAIVIDFLKMKDKAEHQALLDALADYFNEDPCTVQIHGFTNLGFLEITRNQRTPALIDRFHNAMS
ncbi:MAG: ribonuclease E/G [Micavibrio sp.]